MGAILTHKDKGEIEYDMIFVNTGVGQVGKLTGGGYIHVGGIPIKTKKELTDVIPPGKERDEALEWFNNRGKTPEVPTRKLVLQPDGALLFDDGTEVKSHADIINCTPPGALQEYALKWLVEKQNSDALKAQKEASKIRNTVKDIRKEVLKQEEGEEAEE